MLTIIHYTSGFSEVIMEYAEEIKGVSNFSDFSKLKVSKINRTSHLLRGDISYFVDVGDDYKFESTLFKKVGMGYHKTPYKMGPKDFCKYWNDDAVFYPDVLKVSDFPALGTCPLLAGNYLLDKYEYAAEKVPKFLEGDFKAIYQISQGDEILAGYSFYGTIIR
ncbi:unnamed protein product [Diamesa serratosioi]